MYKIFFFFLLLLVFSCCQPSSLDDFSHEGAACTRALIKDLQEIQEREDLGKIEPRLKKQFEKLVDIMVQARLYQQKHLEEEIAFSIVNVSLSQDLLAEIERVYSIEGGKEVVERAQREAMLRLDAKEKMLSKKLPRRLK